MAERISSFDFPVAGKGSVIGAKYSGNSCSVKGLAASSIDTYRMGDVVEFFAVDSLSFTRGVFFNEENPSTRAAMDSRAFDNGGNLLFFSAAWRQPA